MKLSADTQRQVIRLLDAPGVSFRAIGRTCSISPNTAKAVSRLLQDRQLTWLSIQSLDDVTRLFEELANSQADGSLPKLRRQLATTPLLIIDDLGIGGINLQLGPALLDILDYQSMIGSLILTSQYPPSSWYDLFVDPTIADAILDRIVHRAHPLELKGESMRKLKARKTS